MLINRSIMHKENVMINRKEQLETLKIVLRVLPNISGIGVVRVGERDGLTDGLKSGLITIIELNNELTEKEIEVISHLGLQLPLLDKSGDEIKVKRLSLDSDDIKKLKKL